MSVVTWRANFVFGSRQSDILSLAATFLQSGEGDRAKKVLSSLRPNELRDAREAIVATEMCLDVHLLDYALASVERAGECDPDHPELPKLHAECRYRLDRPVTLQAECGEIRATLERLNALASARQESANRHVHIVGNLDSIGGSERRALNLYRILSAHMPTTLWTTAPAHAMYEKECGIRLIAAGDAPANGTLVLIGTYYGCGEWLENGCFDRVVICHNLIEQNQSLLRCLQRIEKIPAHPVTQLTFPSSLFKNVLGLPGEIEYSPVDLARFQPSRKRATSRFTIGRHGRAYVWKFHPNDPAFFRGLVRRGYRVRALGGTVIEHMFSRDAGAKPELIEAGAEDAKDFLGSLDAFVYRKHPQFFETGGSVILEAMAMEIPVIVFPEQCGCAELIVHEENGFLVHSESAALEIIERLKADPDLRTRIGSAARQSLIDVQQRHESRMVDYYRR